MDSQIRTKGIGWGNERPRWRVPARYHRGVATEPSREAHRRSLVSRLRERNGDARPHVVVCGGDALAYTLAQELSQAPQPVRLTVIVPPGLRPDLPDPADLRDVRVIRAVRLDERTFRDAGLAGATALALASTCVDLRVTQVANGTWGVHAVLPTGVLSRRG